MFGPQDIQAMSTALEDICKILNLSDEGKGERSSSRRGSSPLRTRASAVLRSCVTATALSRFDRFAEPSANDCCSLSSPMVSAANGRFPPTLRKHADWV